MHPHLWGQERTQLELMVWLAVSPALDYDAAPAKVVCVGRDGAPSGTCEEAVADQHRVGFVEGKMSGKRLRDGVTTYRVSAHRTRRRAC